MQRKLMFAVFAFIAAALLAACGGADNGYDEYYAVADDEYYAEADDGPADAQEVLLLTYSKPDIGEIMEFGGIYWLVLDVQADRALLLSQYIFGRRPFHEPGGAIIWEYSTIRRYLNSEFLYDRFTADERARIAETRIVNDGSIWDGHRGISPSTFDRVFLLSKPEVVWHLGDITQWPGPTVIFSDQYDNSRIAYGEDGPEGWWLRSPGAFSSNNAAIVSARGTIFMEGTGIARDAAGYRPAMWLRLDGHEAQSVQTALDPWNPDNFADVRQPLTLTHATPHGYIAVRHIEFMNDHLYSRAPFTYREKEAAAWLVEELLAMGHPWENIEVQEFYGYQPLVLNNMWRHWQTSLKMWGGGNMPTRSYSQNVILTIPGQSQRTIIVGAHYDTWPTPGASDNASGTALLLESAQRMLDIDNYHTIVYVFFGAEEVGLLGAHIFYDLLTQEQRGNIVMMVNADVLFEGEYFVFGTGYSPNMQIGLGFLEEMRQNDVSRQVSTIAQELREAHGIQVANVPAIVSMGSDHLVFLQAGHTVVMLSGLHLVPYEDFEGFTRWLYGDYALTTRVLHSPRDCFHYINAAWPNKIDDAMHTFSVLLEGLLLARY